MCERLYCPTDDTTTASSSSIIKCPKCVINEGSGKRSCCARGGAWFKNCGDAGDAHFDHTWAEGIQACKELDSADLVESAVQIMLHHVGVIIQQSMANRSRNLVRGYMHTDRTGSVSNAGSTTDPEKCINLTKLAVCLCISFIIPNLKR